MIKTNVKTLLSLIITYLSLGLFLLLPTSNMLAVSKAPHKPKFLMDHSGRTIKVDSPFKRIISLYPAHTENLIYLGLDKEIIGVSTSDDIKTKKSFSYRDGLEKFLHSKPDLVLIRPMIDRSYGKLVKQLERHGIIVVSLQPTSIDKMYTYWLSLGILTGKEVEAQKMIHNFREKIAYIDQMTLKIKDKKRVFFESMHRYMRTFTNDSISIFTLHKAGGVNIASDAKSLRGSNIADFGKERVIAKGSEIDIYLIQRGAMNVATVTTIKKDPVLQMVKAVKDGGIYEVPERLVSRPTPNLIKGIILIGKVLYPDVFDRKDLSLKVKSQDI